MNSLYEGLGYKDLVGMLKPTVHIDEFSSKMGDDDEIVVVSFFARDKQAAQDLVDWFETGYDFVVDADMSPGEIKPNRYLVYVEIKRRSSTGKHINEIIDDFNTLTEYNADNWIMHYKNKNYPWSVETYDSLVPSSPAEYRRAKETDLNEIRVASGIPVKSSVEENDLTDYLKTAAGLR